MGRPLTCRCSPSLTVSTSGSSGTLPGRHFLCRVSALGGVGSRPCTGQIASAGPAVRRLACTEVVTGRADPGANRGPGRLRGLLLGFLLRPPLTLPADLTADFRDRAEGLLV